MRHRETGIWRISALGAGLLITLGACGNGMTEADGASPVPTEATSAEQASDENLVAIEDFRYQPGDITLAAGDSITWVNQDDILHTVTSGVAQEQGVPGVSENKDARPDGLFDHQMPFEERFTFTFDKAGTYDYYCAIHPGMKASVTVE